MIEAAGVVAEYVARGRNVFEVEWSALARTRDRITHQYWASDSFIVWDTANDDIPLVRDLLAGALQRLG